MQVTKFLENDFFVIIILHHVVNYFNKKGPLICRQAILEDQS
jgi:hypothetical protein